MINASIELTGLLGDVTFLAIIAVFFGICVGLVKFCDRIIGGDADTGVDGRGAVAADDGESPTDTEVAA